MDSLHILALSLGAAWASGINLYAAILVLGGLDRLGVIALPPDLAVLAHPIVLSVAAALYIVEFVADKIPGVDTAWDAVHTFIRIPAGALLAAGAVGGLGQDYPTEYLVVAALLAGAGLAAGSHATKAGGRLLVNTSPEPFSNWLVSLVEDFLAIGGLFLALFMPALFLTLLGGFVLLSIWLLPRLWRILKQLVSRFRHAASGRTGRE